ncbi:MAG: hypothetical protein K9L60_13405 [Methylovulum sp.]|nr:hypothetical protein [Methylovulum sp.]
MKKIVMLASLIGLIGLSNVYACGVQGTAVNSDGSKIDGSGVVSTSWNSEKAYPKNGTYSLDLGSRVCGEKITVYLDGNDGHEVRVDGFATVNFARR